MIKGMGDFIGCGYGSETETAASTLYVRILIFRLKNYVIQNYKYLIKIFLILSYFIF
jgi:hypothetical protein